MTASATHLVDARSIAGIPPAAFSLESPMKVVQLQRLNGTASFMVMFGALYARQVTVRYMDRAFFESLWADGRFANYTREEFERNVLDEVGIVHCSWQQVPPDVVRAVWDELRIEREQSHDRFCKYFTTGSYTQGEGWKISNVCAFPAQAVPESTASDDPDPLTFPVIHVESLSQRPTH